VGLAAAIFARRQGLTVRVLDFRVPPIDKACGEGMMPDGVEILGSLGWMPAKEECASLGGIRYLDGRRVAEARFPRRPGLGIRRPVLHRALVRLAEDAGAKLDWGIRVTGLEGDRLETQRGSVSARWIIGADGLRSKVRQWAGLGERLGRHRRVGVRRHFKVDPWTDLVEVHWAQGCEAYVTPVSPGEIGVALLMNPDEKKGGGGFGHHLKRFPALVGRLAGASVTTIDRGAGPFSRVPHRVCQGRVALVGDAAGYMDAITGEGLSLGFHQAQKLMEAVRDGDLEQYERANRRLVAWPFLLIRALLLVERHPGLRCRLVSTLARDPDLFARLLAIHVRELPPRGLGVGGAARLIRGLLAVP
jgi:flavin-dependent dehydrogenase